MAGLRYQYARNVASPRFAALKREAGRAAQRVRTDEALQVLADVFWFTMEFGVLREGGELRAYGAGILSSYGEIEEFRHMEIRPLDFAEMVTIDYDITKYQPVLYCAESLDHLRPCVPVVFLIAFDDFLIVLEHQRHAVPLQFQLPLS